jgi:tetratricopeptide (TPR) repeat protein
VNGAIDSYLESIRLEPASAVYQMNLGHAYVTLKRDKEAMKAFREAVRLNPQFAEAFYGLGFASLRSSKYREALDAFKRAVALSPDMAKAHYGLAMAYVELDRMDELIQEYRILQRLDSKLAAKLAKALPGLDFNCKGTRPCRSGATVIRLKELQNE